jgi:hypothetical protein
VVENREHQRLQHHRLGEAAGHRQHRGAGEVQLPFGVAVDVAAKPVTGQPVQGAGVKHPVQERQLLVAELEPSHRIEQPGDACDDSVSAAPQPPREDLERAAARRATVG